MKVKKATFPAFSMQDFGGRLFINANNITRTK